MIDTLLLIIDKLIQLRKHRLQNSREVFKRILEPTFKDLSMIHQDYLQMFTKVQWLLPSFKENLQPEDYGKLVNAVEYLRQQRIKFEPLRVEIRSLSTLLGISAPHKSKVRLPKLSTSGRRFVQAVINYFPSGITETSSSESQKLLRLIENSIEPITMERYKSDFDSSDLAGLHLDLRSTIKNCRFKWQAVCERYSVLKTMIETGVSN